MIIRYQKRCKTPNFGYRGIRRVRRTKNPLDLFMGSVKMTEN